ncbi:HNMT [Branchiostoma lanceolatum]|uniref:HNMT protein n=1 Tax=Branchiostoma lanceolatum TaxID=7740 RepID=A0A8J9WDH7_BRALA|nr:HNMT [Branchiostoma lanceolatum]
MAGMLKLGRLNNDTPAHYAATFRVFLTSLELTEEKARQFVGSKVPDSVLCESGAVRVLGIGSGQGESDRVILKRLLQHHDSVYNRVVEPSETMIKKYKALAREDTSLGAVKFDWRQQTAEEYFQTKDDTKFHLIHASHVLYYVEDPVATLRNMWEQLADGGYILLPMESEKGDIGKMKLKMWEDFGQGDRLTTALRFSGDIKGYLDALGISYICENAYVVSLNVTECFKENSESGALLLDFITHTPNASNMPEIRSMALEYIRRNSSVIGDKTIFQSTEETIVVLKKGAKKE